ncbi:hypothetical protein KFL_005660060 [Klebsormidium nitens]|uniref:Uncharacterized protein n=1 Tax=Klebsormidium nitens TaxID=105231 RepID=A0A1Y1IID4_KLENI|nr:hypothetical protein KFL_005660060 [Klebsormidium nitens]|eukprot:GAQ89822.1 hypothetical protein KFL_005660060 [Klebsormidium nitens]
MAALRRQLQWCVLSSNNPRWRPQARCFSGQALEYAEAVEHDFGGASEAEIDMNGRGWRAKNGERLAEGGWKRAQGDTSEMQTAERVWSGAKHERPATSGRGARASSASPQSVEVPASREPQKRGAGLQTEKVFDWEPMAGVGFRGVRPRGLGVRDYLAMKNEVEWFEDGPTSRWVFQDEVEKERIRAFKLTGQFVLGGWSRKQDGASWQLDRRRKGEAILLVEDKGGAEAKRRGPAVGQLEGRGRAEGDIRGKERKVEGRDAFSKGAETADRRSQQGRLVSEERSGVVPAGQRVDVEMLKQQGRRVAAEPFREREVRAETQVRILHAERESITPPTKSAGDSEKDPSSDDHVQAGAEALLDVLRSLPATADVRAELAARVERGLCEWAHLDRACRMLAKGFQGDPLDREVLVAGLSVACGMEMERSRVSRKSALITTVTRYLARGRHFALARAVQDCWPPEEPASRMRTEQVLTAELMKAGAFDEAVAAFKGSLGKGLPLDEVQSAGRDLVRSLIHARQLELAVGATLLVGETGNYAPFVTTIQTLSQERKFLEALYLLDVYLKAVAKPNERMLDSLVAQYAEHGYEQTGLEFLAVLRNGGAMPHGRTFEVLARAYHRAGRPAFVEKIDAARLKVGGKLLEQGRAHLEAGDVSKAGEALAQVVAMLPRVTAAGLPYRTVPGVDVALESLLVAQARAGDTAEAWQVIRWLDARGRCYAIDTPTPLFEAELRKGEGDVIPLMAAFEEHRRFVVGQVAHEGPPTRLHKCLFQFLVGKRLLDAAVAVFEASLEDRVTVRLSNVIRLVYNLIDVGQPGVALRILRKCPKLEREHPGLFHRLLGKAIGELKGPPSE